MRWSFLKAHGLGNDFLLHLQAPGEPRLSPEQVCRLCDRRRGIGADGVVLLTPMSGEGRHRMVLLNSDGLQAEVSGNGMRCAVAALSTWWGGGSRAEVLLQTRAGPRRGRRVPGHGQGAVLLDRLDLIVEVEVQMGTPRFVDPGALAPELRLGADGLLRIRVGQQLVEAFALSMGNPHLVIPCDEPPDDAEVSGLGPLLERHRCFPERTNVMWVSARGTGRMDLKIWERGCGLTPACGSGACAVAAVAMRLGWARAGETVQVQMAGGTLQVTLPGKLDEDLLLRGPVEWIASGEYELRG